MAEEIKFDVEKLTKRVWEINNRKKSESEEEEEKVLSQDELENFKDSIHKGFSEISRLTKKSDK